MVIVRIRFISLSLPVPIITRSIPTVPNIIPSYIGCANIRAINTNMTSSSRPRGGQPGNSNALKHGFYSRKFKDLDVKDLQAVTATIDDEIAALRVAARRVFEYADQVGESDPMDAIKAFGVFGSQVKTIGGLLRTKAIASSNAGDEIARAAIDAILEVAKEWN